MPAARDPATVGTGIAPVRGDGPDTQEAHVEEQSTLEAPGRPGGSRRLRRPRQGRMIAGVAAGLAEHLRIDVTLVRVLFALGALLNLLGVLVYGLLWVLVPADDDPGRPHEPGGASAGGTTRGPGFWAGVALVAVGALWLLPTTGGGVLPGPGVRHGLLLPLALLGIGLALWLSEDRGRQARAGEPGPPSARAEAAGGDAATAPAPAGPEDTVPPAGPPPPPPAPEAPDGGGSAPPPPPSRARSPLARVTLGLALLAAGGLWLAAAVGLAPVRPTAVLSTALAVVALGLLVGSVWGRARLLILAGAPLALVVLAAALAPVVVPPLPFGGTVGQARLTVEEPDELQAEYEHAAGELHLDLRGLELDEDAATRVAVGAGEVRVRLPDDLPVRVDASATVGELRVLGLRRSGVGPSLTMADGEGDAALSLEVRVGAGEVTVTRGDPPGDLRGSPDPLRWEPADTSRWLDRARDTMREVRR